jgi:hypothetical protein
VIRSHYIILGLVVRTITSGKPAWVLLLFNNIDKKCCHVSKQEIFKNILVSCCDIEKNRHIDIEKKISTILNYANFYVYCSIAAKTAKKTKSMKPKSSLGITRFLYEFNVLFRTNCLYVFCEKRQHVCLVCRKAPHTRHDSAMRPIFWFSKVDKFAIWKML